jgi:amino acid adenylation domain-containing protein
MMVHDFLHNAAARHPDKVALVCQERRLSYAWLEQAANRLAHALRETGVTPGDRVCLHLHNSVEAVVGIFAILKAGGVFVAINRSTRTDKLIYVLNNCRATVLLADERALGAGLAERLPGEVPSLKAVVCCGAKTIAETASVLSFEQIQTMFPSAPPACSANKPDLACLIYTSGTTGEPKGVMCGHDNVVFVARSIARYLKNDERDVILNVLPFSSSYGLYQLLTTFLSGGTLVLEQSFAFPAAIMQTMAGERVTGFAGVPTIYSILLGMDLGAIALPCLRYMTNAAAGLSVEHVKRLRQIFPKVDLYLMHGLTEVARTMYLPPEQVDLRPGSSGIAIPGTELWLEDESGQRPGPGETGELIIRGPHVMRGYWDDSALTADRFRPGPLPGERVCHSGDLFRTDDDGYFHFISRKDDIIKSRGEKVAPQEVENVLHAIPGVQDVAVIGVPDPLWGQAVKAFIVAPGAELTAADVMAFCKTRLEEVMLPQHVEFRENLPKSGNGKIRKRELI